MLQVVRRERTGGQSWSREESKGRRAGPLCYLLCIVPVAGAAAPSGALGCREQIGAAAGVGEHIRGLFC